MSTTDQINFRLSKALLFDLDFIAEHTGMQRSDWIRLVLARAINEEKGRIIEEHERRFIAGRLTEDEFKSAIGVKPSAGVRELREKRLHLDKVSKESLLQLVKEVSQGMHGEELQRIMWRSDEEVKD